MGVEKGRHSALVEQTDLEKPCIAFVATKNNSETLAREIIRAKERGYVVLVTHYNEPNTEAVSFAEHLGARIVHPREPDPSESYLKNTLTEIGQTAGAPGVIYHRNLDERLDFDLSAERVESEEYLVDAITEAHEGVLEVGVLVGIPAFNEASTIQSVVDDAATVADEVLVVDDGSEDDTAEIARESGAHVIEHRTNKGYGAALKSIFKEASRRKPDHLVIIDADGQHDSLDIPKLIDHQRETDAEIVIGSRFTKDASTDAPLYRQFGLHVVNVLTNLSMGVIRSKSRIRDTQSGFRTYDQTAIESLATDDSIGDRMSASTDILYHAHHNHFDVEEVGTEITYDVESTSSRNPVSHGFTLVSNILKTVERDRPITALGVPGFFSAFAGLGLGYLTFSNYLATGVFPMGLALTSAVFGLAGIFAAFTAIILHSLNTQLSE